MKNTVAVNRYVMTCTTGASAYNAGAKAPSDINSILSENGFKLIVNRYQSMNRILRLPLILLTPLIQYLKIRKPSFLLFQHPYDTRHDAVRLMNRMLLSLLGKKDVRTVVLIHDLESIRFHEVNIRDEVNLLNSFDFVIVHSDNMRQLLLDNGLTVPVRILGLFDYLVSAGNNMPRTRDGGVCYAGNLSKSRFLSCLPGFADVEFHLYGAECDGLPKESNTKYEGCFRSDDLSSLKGGWGLVWDGASSSREEGDLSDYLAYNSPHKASMYVCAGMPVIVPSWSAVADIVKERNLGIVISSLGDLPEALHAVSEDEYASMLESVEKQADDLRCGRQILRALSGMI